MNVRKLPVGVQNFEKLISNDYLYIDKTEFIWKIVTEGSQFFFESSSPFLESSRKLIKVGVCFFLRKGMLLSGK